MLALPSLAAVKMAAKSTVLWVTIAVLAASNSCSYMVGRAHMKASYAEAQLKESQNQTKAVVKEAEKRAPVVSAKENKAAAQKERVAQAKRNIYYATEARQSNPTCDLSDAEFDGYDVLANEINAAAKRGNVQ